MDSVSIQWTETAKAGLAKLPQKVRRGLLDKANELCLTENPRDVNKRLTGPLQGYYRICYSRYRAIYRVDREKLTNGKVLQKIVVLFVAAGIRKEGDKNDIYRFAQRLIDLGVIKAHRKQKN
ncbi:MAG: type II toxin-antitoxin system RelE/ParE family toxin [Planctomycetota bacterium]|nr:type II toxin-antitoxin system RelE/ParE family toxin [Planctomycetota bacterium]